MDPDILVTGTLDGLFEKLDASDIVLTPHLDQDYPADGLLPDDGYILRAGQFNLGFIGVSATENAQSFLNWWKNAILSPDYYIKTPSSHGMRSVIKPFHC